MALLYVLLGRVLPELLPYFFARDTFVHFDPLLGWSILRRKGSM
jgi:hypothetical protein